MLQEYRYSDVRTQATEAEATAAEQRIAAAALEARASAARAALLGKSVTIKGHSRAKFNGVYTHDSEHEGWPVLKNAKGIYCYHYKQLEQWVLFSSHDLATDFTDAYIKAPDGPLPLGAAVWQCWVGGDRQKNRLAEGSWVRKKLTLTLH